MRETQFSFVLETPAAEVEDAERHFRSKLSFETDAWDVKTDMERGRTDLKIVESSHIAFVRK